MRWLHRPLILFLLGLVSVSSAPLHAFAQENLKIGGVGTLSGSGTAWGLATVRGTEIAIDELMEAGGLKVGGKVYKPRLVMLDDGYTGQGGKTAAERLLFQEQVRFILGPIGSPPTLGVVGELDEARETSGIKALMLSDGAALDILKNKYHAPFNFLIANTNREYAPSMVRWLRQHYPELKSVGLLAPNDAVGQVVVPVLVEAYKQAGITVHFEMFERGTKEFTPLLTRMLAAGVDALDLNNNTPGDSALIYKQARQIGFRNHIWQIGGPAVQETIDLVGPLSDGFLSYDLFDFSSPQGQTLVDAYHKKYGAGAINAFTPIMYNAAKILFAAMQKADSLDPEKVRDEVQKMDGFDMPLFGPLKWGGLQIYGVDHQLELPFLVVEVHNGKITTRDVLKP